MDEIRQAGAQGIVTALHQIPVGEVWPIESITERKRMIADAGLKWVVTESLPVSEDIKKRSGDYHQHIENYKISLCNLAECGIRTVCYNFMPVLDWSRTELRLTAGDGSYTSGFQLQAFAAFDLFILKRNGAEEDYPPEILDAAKAFFNDLGKEGQRELQATILYGLPGSMLTYTPEEFQLLLDSYREIDRSRLKEHLAEFLKEVVPVAEACDIKMAIHPDDPPWNLLGLPRIAGSLQDLKDVVAMVDSPSNGITLCTGSLGAGHFNNLHEIATELASSIHFVHLRNVVRDPGLNFREDSFFDGDIDMVEVVKALIKNEDLREAEDGKEWIVPIRPDHGHQILDDIGLDNYPGYSLYGRMKNLAEIKGLTLGLLNAFS